MKMVNIRRFTMIMLQLIQKTATSQLGWPSFNTKGSLVTLEDYNDSYSKKLGGRSSEYHQIKRISAFRNEEGKEKTLQRSNGQKSTAK